MSTVVSWSSAQPIIDITNNIIFNHINSSQRRWLCLAKVAKVGWSAMAMVRGGTTSKGNSLEGPAPSRGKLHSSASSLRGYSWRSTCCEEEVSGNLIATPLCAFTRGGVFFHQLLCPNTRHLLPFNNYETPPLTHIIGPRPYCM